MCTTSTLFRDLRDGFSSMLKNVVGTDPTPCAIRCREIRFPCRQRDGKRLNFGEGRKCVSLRNPSLLNKRAQRYAVIQTLVHSLHRGCTSAPRISWETGALTAVMPAHQVPFASV